MSEVESAAVVELPAAASVDACIQEVLRLESGETVQIDPAIEALFPLTDTLPLVETIGSYGVDIPIFIGKSDAGVVVLKGSHIAKIIGSFWAQGEHSAANGRDIKPIFLPVHQTVFEGLEADRELRGIAIRLHLADKNLEPAQIDGVICAALTADHKDGIYRTGTWLAQEFGVPESRISRLRIKLEDAGTIDTPKFYKKRNGDPFPNPRVDPKTGKRLDAGKPPEAKTKPKAKATDPVEVAPKPPEPVNTPDPDQNPAEPATPAPEVSRAIRVDNLEVDDEESIHPLDEAFEQIVEAAGLTVVAGFASPEALFDELRRLDGFEVEDFVGVWTALVEAIQAKTEVKTVRGFKVLAMKKDEPETPQAAPRVDRRRRNQPASMA